LNLKRGDSVSVLVFNHTTGKLILVSQLRYATYMKTKSRTIAAIAEMMALMKYLKNSTA
jgi:hypothetical protein